MGLVRLEIDRRSFLKAAAPLALGFRAIARGQIPIERGRFSEAEIPAAREQLLKQVNAERLSAGLSQLELDDLACKVASEHALDMVKGEFLSHWGSDGRKFYHRYSFAGGTDAAQENASAAEYIQSVTPTAVTRDLRDMHVSMLEETPPNEVIARRFLIPITHMSDSGSPCRVIVSDSTSFIWPATFASIQSPARKNRNQPSS